MSLSPETAIASFAVVLAALEDTLDWQRLGDLYCEEGGEQFFPEAQREAIQDTGLKFAADLADLLAPGGRSVYIGAGVAELVPMVFEAVVLGRDVRAITLPGFEPDELNRGLAVASEAARVPLPRLVTGRWKPAEHAPADHLWIVSVLTDPDAFPALHDRLYDRRGGPLATGRGSEQRERTRAEDLIGRGLRTLSLPAFVTTTDEELGILMDVAKAARLVVLPPQRARLSAIVGDPVRTCALRPLGRS